MMKKRRHLRVFPFFMPFHQTKVPKDEEKNLKHKLSEAGNAL
jgi:hypothetical protein